MIFAVLVDICALVVADLLRKLLVLGQIDVIVLQLVAVLVLAAALLVVTAAAAAVAVAAVALLEKSAGYFAVGGAVVE